MKHLPTSLYLTGKSLKSPGQWGERCIATKTFEDPGRIDLMWGPAPSRRAGALGDRHRRRDSADTVDIVPSEAREGTCEGRGAEFRYRAIHVWKLKWKFGTSGGWGSEGSVNVVGNTVRRGRK